MILSIIVGIVMGSVVIMSITGMAIKEHAKLQRFKMEEETKRLLHQSKLVELEVRKEEAVARRLQAENRKYDRAIEQITGKPTPSVTDQN
ncbi:MAG: hypothetical protein LBC46_03620 [Treponema sp.]|jgi:uncharacterized membrane-anchored protein YhcB (DUF1043 family)|nr:hypothetical protein [Treponema sp.]